MVKLFGDISKITRLTIIFGWLALFLVFWISYGYNDVKLFPTITQVLTGFKELYVNNGLISHIGFSLSLCYKSILISIIVSLLIVYASPIPLLTPIANFISKFRFLPLTGISFYITMLVSSGRTVQIYILVIFMSTFLITSLLSLIKNIPKEEFDHARTLGCTRWEVLLEVIIKAKFHHVFEIIRQNIAIVWMMLVTVESTMSSSGGLGFLIKNSDKFMNHGKIIALQIVILLIGIFLDYSINISRKLLFKYSTF